MRRHSGSPWGVRPERGCSRESGQGAQGGDKGYVAASQSSGKVKVPVCDYPGVVSFLSLQ